MVTSRRMNNQSWCPWRSHLLSLIDPAPLASELQVTATMSRLAILLSISLLPLVHGMPAFSPPAAGYISLSSSFSFHRLTLRSSSLVNLRIEGLTNTIYEAPIFSGPRNITTASGGTHPCTGTNLNANPNPGNTPTDALDAASKLLNFPYDATYSTTFEDYFITSIDGTTQTSTQFWALLLNYEFTTVGGCQQEVGPGDHVLWAFDGFNKHTILKVSPDRLVARVGQTRSVSVIDGATGNPISGALIDGVTTDADGKATLSFSRRGVFEYKATRDDSIRSNALYVVVT